MYRPWREVREVRSLQGAVGPTTVPFLAICRLREYPWAMRFPKRLRIV
jgi:hypothetical protein